MKKTAPTTCFFCAAALCIGIALTAPVALFADQDDGSALATKAQVQQAEQLAQETAMQMMVQARNAVQAEIQARKALDKALQTNNAEVIGQARQAHRAAENHAQAQLARANAVSQSDVAATRAQHMNWGQVALHMGMDPADIGVSHKGENYAAQHQHSELSQATARDAEFGHSGTHSAGGFGGSHGNTGHDAEMGVHNAGTAGHDTGFGHDGIGHGGGGDSGHGGGSGDGGHGGGSGDGGPGGGGSSGH